jgi:hypothetical protein
LTLAVVKGYGKHKKDLTHQQLIDCLRVGQRLFTGNNPLDKCNYFYSGSILRKSSTNWSWVSTRPRFSFYLRTFVSNVFRWLCSVNLCVVVGWTIGSSFATIFQLLRGGRVSVVGNSLYASARYARRWWWRGGGASQAEAGTPAKGHLADRMFCIYKYQLATQLDSQ